MNRREAIQAGLALGAGAIMPHSIVLAQTEGLIQRKMPGSDERVPVIGIGTARRYDVSQNDPRRSELKEVLRQFAAAGGKVIDTAPSYGSAEGVVGDLVSELGVRQSLLLATKVGATRKEAGIQQIEESFRRLHTKQIDCIAVHNLMNAAEHLALLRDLKAEGRIRYVGISTSFEKQHAELENIVKREKPDIVQVDYALDNRRAGERIIPAAAERGIGVMINLPFGRGRLFRAAQDKPLPKWAAEFDCHTWAQFFLKYIVSHPGVTCAIPGTAQLKYLADNLGAARGRLPDQAMRRRMEDFIDTLG